MVTIGSRALAPQNDGAPAEAAFSQPVVDSVQNSYRT
jgi:hypothetical protein